MHDGPVAWVRAVDVEGYPTHNLPFESHNVLKILYEFAKAERAGTMSLCGPLLTTVSHQRVLGLVLPRFCGQVRKEWLKGIIHSQGPGLVGIYSVFLEIGSS